MADRQPAMQGRDKLSFMLALVPWLVDRDRVSVADAAAHFGVPEDSIRDAVRLIAVSGVPGDTRAYQPDDLFDISWDEFEEHDAIVLTHRVAIDDAPRFSAREAAALIAGLQYLSSLPENADSAAIASLQSKLSRSASAAPSQVAVSGGEADATLALLRGAIDRGVQVELDYVSATGDRERRRVDPLRIESIDADWYVRGWCHARGAIRTFRLDRIADAIVTDDAIQHAAVALPDQLFVGSPDDVDVEVDIAASALPLIADYLAADAPRAESGGRVRTTLRVSNLGSIARLAAGLAGVAVVTGPDAARREVRERAERALARYR